MKKSVFLLFLSFICSGYVFCQVAQDSLGGNYIYPRFCDNFSAEGSWEIHKEAYVKQLRAKGLTVDEIEKKITAYEKQKEEFIAQIYEQRRLAAIQRKKADGQRKLAEIQRQKADEQRKQADILRKQANDNRTQNNIQREKAEEQRKQADIHRKKADEQRKLADIHRKKAEEWRNSFENILTEKITLLGQSVNTIPLIFKVNKKTILLFNINAKVSSGTTLIEIFNPNKEKVGELSLEHKKTSGLTKENAFFKSTSGCLNKTISDSEVGDWQIKILSQKSEGTVTISVAQYLKPTVDE
jgi:hypothetical protein